MNEYYLEEGFPFSGRKLDRLKNFLKQGNLDYDPQIEYSVLLCTADGQIAAAGSRHHNILKCLAVSEDHQGYGCMNTVVSRLLANAHTEGHSHLFLFTKPKNLPIFEDLGFYCILKTEDVALMENIRDGIRHYLAQETKALPVLPSDAKVGAIVMNANPFTLGHFYLVEEASRQCDFLHIFVLSQPVPPFSPEARLKLVQEGCGHLPNVFVHGGSDYLISHATFPDYFLKDKKSALSANATLDLLLFCHYFKEAFHITNRFVGEEPFCPVTASYNRQMQKILPKWGIEVCVIPRCQNEGVAISATQVRALLKEGRLQEIAPLVPETTFSFLTAAFQNKGEEQTYDSDNS